ncbi:MAG: hypothetical protein ABR548_11615 [Actinomycetota bacterium]|nr:hypothetical protein [Actinomycetota bacterium]
MKRFAHALFTAALMVTMTAVPAGAADAPNAIINGKALAVAAQDLLYLNPNFDVYPVYSLSRNDNLSSYDLSGGTWPGFLLDAFMDFYGFGKPERSALGIVETQYPGLPRSADAGTSDYGRSNLNNACEFLFGPQGPSPNATVLEQCSAYVQSMIDDKSSKQLASHGFSDSLVSNGWAKLDRAVLAPDVVADHVQSISSTTAVSGIEVSTATEIISGLQIGSLLRIGTLTATAVATAGPTGKDARSLLSLTDVTYGGQNTVIDDKGVHVLLDSGTQDVTAQLAAQGFDIRLTQGRTYDDGPARVAESGGLVVRMSRDSLPDQLVTANDTMCTTFSGPPFNQMPEIYRVKGDYPNPLYGVIPFVPMPESVTVDEPVPPVVPCVYPNLSYDIGVLVGTTQASAQFTVLPPVAPVGGDAGFRTPTQRVIYDTITTPGARVAGPRTPAIAPQPVVTLRRVRHGALALTAAVGSRIKLVYAAIWLLLVLIVVGRFALRMLAAP